MGAVGLCLLPCNNKTPYGYCQSTVCTNYMYTCGTFYQMTCEHCHKTFYEKLWQDIDKYQCPYCGGMTKYERLY